MAGNGVVCSTAGGLCLAVCGGKRMEGVWVRVVSGVRMNGVQVIQETANGQRGSGGRLVNV